MGKFGAVKRAPGAAKRGVKKVGRAGKAAASIRVKTTTLRRNSGHPASSTKSTVVSMKKGGKKVGIAASKVSKKGVLNYQTRRGLHQLKTKSTARAVKGVSTVKSTQKGKTASEVKVKQSRRTVRGGGASMTSTKTSGKKGRAYQKNRKLAGKYDGETFTMTQSKQGTRGLKGKSTTKRTGSTNTTDNVTLNTSRSFKPSIGGKKVKKTSVKNASGGNDTTMNYQKRPISARNAAIGGTAGAGGYITYKRKTPSGKTITVRRKR